MSDVAIQALAYIKSSQASTKKCLPGHSFTFYKISVYNVKKTFGWGGVAPHESRKNKKSNLLMAVPKSKADKMHR